MKKTKHLILIISLCIGYSTIKSQDLSLMSITQRDSLLISIAKEVVLMYGHDYYRDKFSSIIEQSMVPLRGENNPTGVNAGRVMYHITFLYDKTEEVLERNFAAKVHIWGDTGLPSGVDFGNGLGNSIPEKLDWRNATPNPMLYQESIFPIFDFNNIIPGQDPTTRDPINKDELLHRGWQRNSDGVWERTRPDAPPASAQRAIKQAKEDVRRREAEREKNRGGDENRD